MFHSSVSEVVGVPNVMDDLLSHSLGVTAEGLSVGHAMTGPCLYQRSKLITGVLAACADLLNLIADPTISRSLACWLGKVRMLP